MAAPIMIIPGKNQVLHYVARQMEGIADVVVLNSANDALWQARQAPPRIVLSDVQLEDMSGAELAEIMPNFAPQTRIVICGQAPPTVIEQIRAVGAEWLPLNSSAAENIRVVYHALDVAPPINLPTTGELNLAPQARPTATQPKPSRPRDTAPNPPAPIERPAPAPAAAPPAPATPPSAQATASSPADSFTNATSLVIQPQQHQVLTKLLDLVASEVEAQCVLLIDPAGMVLVQSGVMPNVVMEFVGPLLATSFSTTGQLARHLQEQQTNATYIHEGERYDIYAFNVSYRMSLIIMFDKRINPGKLGTVWIYARRAMRQLQQILKLS